MLKGMYQEKRRPSTGEQFSQAIQQTSQAIGQQKQQQQKGEALKSLGINPNLPPEIQKLAFEAKQAQELQRQKYDFENKKLRSENQENLAPFEAGLQTVNRMREIRNKKNIGFNSKLIGIWDPKTRQDRAEYETLGNSLISLASTIPIRNKAEFETLTGKLNDPSLTLSEIDGVLNALEKIITQNMQQYLSGGNQTNQIMPRQQQSRPPLSAFKKG